MTLTKTNQFNDICGGMSYTYAVQWEGETVGDVLEEIREYTKHDVRFRKVDGFGCTEDSFGTAWAIKIDGKTYLSLWLGDEKTYDGDGSERVRRISAYGGWYCGINFNIETEEGT